MSRRKAPPSVVARHAPTRNEDADRLRCETCGRPLDTSERRYCSDACESLARKPLPKTPRPSVVAPTCATCRHFSSDAARYVGRCLNPANAEVSDAEMHNPQPRRTHSPQTYGSETCDHHEVKNATR